MGWLALVARLLPCMGEPVPEVDATARAPDGVSEAVRVAFRTVTGYRRPVGPHSTR